MWIVLNEAGKIGKREDLSKFDEGQIVLTLWLGQGVSKTVALVACSRSAVVNIYQRGPVEGRSIIHSAL